MVVFIFVMWLMANGFGVVVLIKMASMKQYSVKYDVSQGYERNMLFQYVDMKGGTQDHKMWQNPR